MKKIVLAILFTLLFNTPKSLAQATPYVGQIASVGFNFAPIGWLKCEGQLVQIAEFETLFNLIGTTYGGDGQTTFALPDYRGRTLIGVGQGPGLSSRVLGEQGGTTSPTLSVANLPAHSHTIGANTNAGTSSNPTNGVFANSGALDKEFSSTPNTTMSPTGNSGNPAPQPLNTTQPYLGITYIIAYEGIFPF